MAQDTIRYNDSYLAVPLGLQFHTLFYNEARLSDPPQQLDDFATLGTPTNPVALPLDFQGLYWGLAAFGGSPLLRDGSFELENSGLLPWLSWLATYRDDPRFLFRGGEESESEVGGVSPAFREGEAVLDVAYASQALPLSEAVGELLGVHSLPAGPVAAARPWATSEVLYLRPGLTPEITALALDFAAFLTAEPAQNELFRTTGFLPVNIKVTGTADDPDNVTDGRWSGLL